MAYNELVKNMDHVRSYMRDFYVYGFKSRDDYGEKRSYDDEKRRMESWLGDHMTFRRTAEGKYAFISIDSRHVSHNPLFQAWKAKSFTNGDITLHFILFDIFVNADIPLSLNEIMQQADEYLHRFQNPLLLDESTVRKKLKEYADEGLLHVLKEGKRAVYALNTDGQASPSRTALDFFSEVAPCGVIGSFLLDRIPEGKDVFAFKHHYITSAIDSEIAYRALDALSKRRYVELSTITKQRKTPKYVRVLPLQLYVSVQNGRQYLMSWYPGSKQFCAYRLDYILDVNPLEVCENFNEHRKRLEENKGYMWGVQSRNCKKEHLQRVDFTLRIDDGEDYVYERLLREKRCGQVERLDAHTLHFSAEVYDLNEMIPWMRTFICRISSLHMSNAALEDKFKRDIQKMYRLYEIGGDDDAI